MNMPQTVVVTEDHLKLLPELNIEWDEYAEYAGAPEINPKRPYGNSDVYGDIAETLEWTLPLDHFGDPEMSFSQINAAKILHREMCAVLQVLVQNPTTFGVGTWRNTHPYAPSGVRYTKAES